MRHKFVMIFTFCTAIVMTSVFSVGNAWSDTKKVPDAELKIQKKRTPPRATEAVRPVIKSNPYPSNVYAYDCPCKDSVEPAGGILMKGVIVRLRNIKCPGAIKTSPVSGRVKFTWYDLKDNRLKSVTKPFTDLRASLSVVMLPPSQTILASKRNNLVAEIVQINGVEDCDPGHNKITIATCVMEPVH